MSRVPSRTLGLGRPLPTLVQLPHRGSLHSFPKPSPLKSESLSWALLAHKLTGLPRLTRQERESVPCCDTTALVIQKLGG